MIRRATRARLFIIRGRNLIKTEESSKETIKVSLKINSSSDSVNSNSKGETKMKEENKRKTQVQTSNCLMMRMIWTIKGKRACKRKQRKDKDYPPKWYQSNWYSFQWELRTEGRNKKNVYRDWKVQIIT